MALKHRDLRRVALREHEPPQASDVLDLATCTNGYGPAPAIEEALRAAVSDDALRGYPDPTSRPAREAIATRFHTTPERVIMGNGAFELLWTAARVLVRSGDTVLTVEPGSPELGAAARHLGARVVQWRAVERSAHRVDLEQVGDLMGLERPAVVSLAAPTTPAGSPIPFRDLHAHRNRAPTAGTRARALTASLVAQRSDPLRYS